MKDQISKNTQAVLLLTTSLSMSEDKDAPNTLSDSEYRNLRKRLFDLKSSPADLLDRDVESLVGKCSDIVAESRVHKLLRRRFRLGLAAEKWHNRAIWVVSCEDAEYPKNRLGDDAPLILYGCGNKGLLNSGGLSVVGLCGEVNDDIKRCIEQIGNLICKSERVVVSPGEDEVGKLLRGNTLKNGGSMISVVSAGLSKMAVVRENRNMIMKDQLLLLSTSEPRLDVDASGNLRRNELVYALADAVLVLTSENAEQEDRTTNLEPLNVLESMRFYVHSVGGASSTAKALKEKGASDWPEPQDAEELGRLLDEVADARMRPETGWVNSLARMARGSLRWLRGLFGRQGDDG